MLYNKKLFSLHIFIMLENFYFCFKKRNTMNTELLFADQEMEGLKEGKRNLTFQPNKSEIEHV